MKPVTTEHTNSKAELLGGTEENDLPLHSTYEESSELPVMVSTWELTSEERRRAAVGERVCLTIFGMAHPPVGLALEGDMYEHHERALEADPLYKACHLAAQYTVRGKDMSVGEEADRLYAAAVAGEELHP